VTVRAPVGGTVRIAWDTWGVPHVEGGSSRDVFVGLGYAMAQERLWQLDYMRRLARGELAAVAGTSAVQSDRTMRVLGLGRTAERDWGVIDPEVGEALDALAAGINLWMSHAKALPVEFERLGYSPAPWRPSDSIAIWKYRWWYNTGRLELTALAEIAKRTLPPELEAAFSTAEWGHETIVPTGASESDDAGGSPRGERPRPGRGGGAAGTDSAEGSNNWGVAAPKSATGKPILCSDPHNPFAAPSQWFEAQLTCPQFDAIGAVYQGLPTVYIGRNRHVAWGVTNHNAPARDVYQEDPAGPFDSHEETIEVKGGAPARFTLRSSQRGPILDPGNGLLPDGMAKMLGGPTLSLRWVGHDPDTGLGSALALQRARDAEEVLAALERWPCPPLNFVYACADGRFGYHVAGRIPNRPAGGRGIRPADDPAHAWTGDVPFDELPEMADPSRGWVATANNPPWRGEENRRYLGLAVWADGYRMRRIRERLEARPKLGVDEVAAAQGDVESARARDLRPRVVELLEPVRDRRTRAAVRRLLAWDLRLSTDSVAASIWCAFWEAWCRDLARERFDGALVPLVSPLIGNVARRTLEGEDVGWVPAGEVAERVRKAFAAALERLPREAGPRMAGWRWGRLHTVDWRHPLFDDLATGPLPTSGGSTVRAAGYGVGSFKVVSGSTYRFVADFASPTARSTTNLGQSAHPTSRHFRDQTRLWLEDRYKPLWMERSDVAANLEGITTLSP
jgi:penicillin amidase